MRYQYKVKNFRVFDEEGVKLDMAPITILTGCNSSGKSSFVKSMLLVNDVLNKLSRDGKLRTGVQVDFTKKPNNLLGTFDNVIHRGSKSKNITVEYTVPSLLLNEDVVVTMTLIRSGKLNGGVLNEIIISRKDGSMLFHTKPEDEIISKTTLCADLRSPFFRYVFAQNKKYFLDGTLYKLAEKADNDGLMEKVKKETESLEPYYNANKEWIDNIHSSISAIKRLVPNIKRHSEYLHNDSFGITDRQIYKENLFYSPILESLCETTKDNFESLAKSIAGKGKTSDVYDIALCYIESVAKQFKASEFENFSDYFYHLYNIFFCNEISVDEIVPYYGVYESLSGYNRFTEQAISAEMLKDFCGNDSLGDLYNLIKLLTGLSSSKDFNEIYSIEKPNWYVTYFDYIDLVIKEILSYRIPTEIDYVPTSIVNIKRLYSFDDEMDHMTKLFKNYIFSKQFNSGGTYPFANRWLKELKIGEKILVESLDGIGCAAKIFQENDEKGQLLADFGYGVSQLISLLLRIEMEANYHYPIVEGSSDMDYEEKDERNLKLRFRKPFTMVLEEPEVHLHPKIQSMLADILLDAYETFNIHFIVETHSEYLIRKTQVLVAQMGFENNVESVEKSPFITYYIPENSKPYSLDYRKDGKFMESFGTGFYDEASNLAFELL